MTKIGLITGWLLLVVGGYRFIAGLTVAIMVDNKTNRDLAAYRYLMSGSTGEAINEGMAMVAAGLLIGLLAVIAKNTDASE